jgi:hypothetical protein
MKPLSFAASAGLRRDCPAKQRRLSSGAPLGAKGDWCRRVALFPGFRVRTLSLRSGWLTPRLSGEAAKAVLRSSVRSEGGLVQESRTFSRFSRSHAVATIRLAYAATVLRSSEGFPPSSSSGARRAKGNWCRSVALLRCRSESERNGTRRDISATLRSVFWVTPHEPKGLSQETAACFTSTCFVAKRIPTGAMSGIQPISKPASSRTTKASRCIRQVTNPGN